ncbi:MAG: NUDIX domain-containing protein [Pseudomonadota bacterium]
MSKLTSDAIILAGKGEDLKVLLIKRKHPPFENHWAFPGGFLNDGEDPMEGCERELEEETSLDLAGSPWIPLSRRENEGRDPRGMTITYPFLLWQSKTFPVHGQDDATLARWVKLLEIEELAFDHGAILCEALSRFWPGMPSFHPSLANITLPSLLLKKLAKQEEMIFFGGSFNPWHQGHSACLDLCLEAFPEKMITIIPDYSPWKKESAKGQGCSWKSFMTLCRSLADRPCPIYPGFWGKETPNPTVSWLPQSSYVHKSFLMGDDTFATIGEWDQSAVVIRSLESVYVVPRCASSEAVEKVKDSISKINPHLKIIILPRHDYQDVSSTGIRLLSKP